MLDTIIGFGKNVILLPLTFYNVYCLKFRVSFFVEFKVRPRKYVYFSIVYCHLEAAFSRVAFQYFKEYCQGNFNVELCMSAFSFTKLACIFHSDSSIIRGNLVYFVNCV